MGSASKLLSSKTLAFTKGKKNRCVITIGNTRIPFNPSNPNNPFPEGNTAAPDQIYNIKYFDGILSISTRSALDISISGTPAVVKGLVLGTNGKVKLESKQALILEQGLIIEANEAVVRTPITTPGIVNIYTNKLSISSAVHATNAIIRSTKMVTTADLVTENLAIKGDSLIQTAGSKIVTGKPVEMSRNDLNEKDPIQNVFMGCYKQLDKLTIVNDKKAIHKTFRERTAVEHIKNSVVDIVKESINVEQRLSIIDMNTVKLSGQMAGKNLKIKAKDKLNLRGKIVVNNLKLDSNYIYSAYGSVVDGVEKLELRGDKALVFGYLQADDVNQRMNKVAVLFFGKLRGSVKTILNNCFTFVGLGGRLWGMDVICNTGIFLNLGGWVAAYNFVLDTFIPLDLGLTTPYLPRTWKEAKAMVNVPKIMAMIKSIATFIYKPLGIALRVGLKVLTIGRNIERIRKAYYNHSDVNEEMDYIDYLNIGLAFKNIAYAGSAVADAKTVVEQVKTTEFKYPTNYSEAKESLQNNWQGLLLSSAPAFMPCYIVDSWRGVRAGVTITGGEVTTNTGSYNKYQYSRNFKV